MIDETSFQNIASSHEIVKSLDNLTPDYKYIDTFKIILEQYYRVAG